MKKLKVQSHAIKKPYKIKKMGTSGLRETQHVYNQPMFLEQFIQGIALFFKELTDDREIAEKNKTIIVAGDPREGNRERIRRIASILGANGFDILIAKDGIASTPAMSHAIRQLNVAGGIILTASHNPFTDVGIKVNMSDGAPANDRDIQRINELQNKVKSVHLIDYDRFAEMEKITEIDIVAIYADLLDKIFDFDEMKNAIEKNGIRGAFDCMYGAAGPFAEEIFINRLNMDADLLRSEPREDLGGYDKKGNPLHPEPDFDYIGLLKEHNSSGEYEIVSAWDSDVDRRLDGGKDFFIESADEFALFAKYSHLINISALYREKIFFCRSTVTAATIDLMLPFLQEKYPSKSIQIIETPTGFKWIAELGNWGVEESNGVGNPYLREKDGIFSTCFLLKIMLETGKTPRQLMEEIWAQFGRVYFTRGEVSGARASEARQLTKILDTAGKLVGKKFGGLVLESAGSWDYVHPETGSIASKKAAWVLKFSQGNTIKARFSGTGSGGYMLRVYCSKYDKKFNLPKSEITKQMKSAFDDFLKKSGFPGKSRQYTDKNQPDPYKKKKK
ncbi:MAG TPA: hypothetical protein P5346_08135 [Spirochaetota bacterium]|nr:hypothetical protein [Spirochaetota bacterium]